MAQVCTELKPWFSPLRTSAFVRDYWRKRHYFSDARPQRLRSLSLAAGGFALRDLIGIASGEIRAWFQENGEPDYALRVPSNLAEALHRAGLTVYFDLDPRNDAVARLLNDAAFVLGHNPSRIVASVFASRRGCRTVRHVDFVDNLTLQLSGRKRWTLGPTATGKASSRIDWLTMIGEGSEKDVSFTGKPVSVELRPGAFLYCPAEWLHETSTLEDSVSLNVAVHKYRWSDLLSNILTESLLKSPVWNEAAAGLWGSAPQRQSGLLQISKMLEELGARLPHLVRREFGIGSTDASPGEPPRSATLDRTKGRSRKKRSRKRRDVRGGQQ